MKSGETTRDDALRAGRIGEKSVARGFMAAVTAVMLLYLLLSIYSCINEQFINPNFNDFRYTEFLISYEGGFVRRGLLGDILYRVCVVTGADPIVLIRTLCIAAYLFTTIYLVAKFREKGLTLLLLATPFMCGYLHDFIRKDYLQMALLIAIYILLKRPNPPVLHIIASLLLGIIGLFLHEAFIFWGLPVAVLALISHKKTKWWGLASCIVFIGCFFLFAHFKGSTEHAYKIINCWNSLPGVPTIEKTDHSIMALGWETADTIKMHLQSNFHNNGMAGWSGIAVRPIWMLIIYYFLSNVLFTLRGNNTDAPGSDKTAFSALLLFSILCLLPMYLFLSCDYGRLYQYLTMSVVLAYVTFSPEMFRTLLPSRALNNIARINSWIAGICKPGPYLMLILMLIVASAPVGYTPLGDLKASPLGTILFSVAIRLGML